MYLRTHVHLTAREMGQTASTARANVFWQQLMMPLKATDDTNPFGQSLNSKWCATLVTLFSHFYFIY